MELDSLIYGIVAFLFAALIAYTLTPPVRLLAFRIGAIDIPTDARRMHKKPTPRIGGLAIFAAFTAATLIFCELNDLNSSMLYSIWIGGGVLVILGILDDIFRLNAWLKLFVQIGAAAIAVLIFDLRIENITVFGANIDFGGFAIPITMLWIVGLSNAINLIDGLDGLSCGISVITSISLFLVMVISGETAFAMIVAILIGACLGFLPYNKNPAKIFMGDTGALFLGYAFSIISVSGLFKLHAVLSFLVPLSIFAFPLIDTLTAIIRRLIHGQSPFHPDRGHLHHKLVDKGLTQKEAVKLLYAISALMGLVAVVYTDSMFGEASTKVWKAIVVLGVAVIILILVYICMLKPSTRVLSGLSEHLSEIKMEEAEKERAEKEKAEAEKSKAEKNK